MLSNENIKIRHVEEKDLDDFIRLGNDLSIRGEYLPCSLTSPQQKKQQFKEDGFSTEHHETLLIVDTDDNMIGTIWHFKSVPYFNAREIGYTLFNIEQRGKNIVSQAVHLLTNYLFSSLHINRLEIRMDTKNLASEKVAIKCGFIKEGTSRGANYVRGKHVDMHLYAKLRGEWAAESECNSLADSHKQNR